MSRVPLGPEVRVGASRADLRALARIVRAVVRDLQLPLTATSYAAVVVHITDDGPDIVLPIFNPVRKRAKKKAKKK